MADPPKSLYTEKTDGASLGLFCVGKAGRLSLHPPAGQSPVLPAGQSPVLPGTNLIGNVILSSEHRKAQGK